MTVRALRPFRFVIVALAIVFAVQACGKKSPAGPGTTTTTSTTTTTTSTTTSVAPSFATLTVVVDGSCSGIVQSSGLDVFLDGNLVGVSKVGAPLVLTTSFGTHRIRARYNQGFLPETTFTISQSAPFFTFTILC